MAISGLSRSRSCIAVLIISLLVLLPCLTQARIARSSRSFAATHTDELQAVPSDTNGTIANLENHVLPPPSPRRIQARVGGLKAPPPATDQQMKEGAVKGCNMLYMMSANAADALTRMKKMKPGLTLISSESTWTNAGDLKKYGWTEKSNDINWAYMGVNDMIAALKIDKMDEAGKNYQLLQNQAVTVDGKRYAISGGTYNQAINPAAGFVIAYYSYSPNHEAKKNNVPGTVVPLAQYWDVLWLEYIEQAWRMKPVSDVKKLQHFIFLNVEDPDT